MIHQSELFPIGKIISPHGISGEMSFSFTTDVFDTEQAEFFVFDIDGIFVPFYIESYRFKTNTTAILKLEDASDDQQARQFSGLTIYLPKKFLEQVEDADIGLDYFLGFRVEDQNGLDLGLITEVDQSTENLLFVVEKGEELVLVPANEDLIQSINHEQKQVIIFIPDGLFDL